jgi:hypothetical protein
VDGAGSQEWEADEGARVLRGALAALTRDGSFPLDGLTPRSPASAAALHPVGPSDDLRGRR